jgi:hypothetical protein
MYNDACDEGLRVVNTRRGTSMVFGLEEADGEAWRYVSIRGSIRLTIFND